MTFHPAPSDGELTDELINQLWDQLDYQAPLPIEMEYEMGLLPTSTAPRIPTKNEWIVVSVLAGILVLLCLSLTLQVAVSSTPKPTPGRRILTFVLDDGPVMEPSDGPIHDCRTWTILGDVNPIGSARHENFILRVSWGSEADDSEAIPINNDGIFRGAMDYQPTLTFVVNTATGTRRSDEYTIALPTKHATCRLILDFSYEFRP